MATYRVPKDHTIATTITEDQHTRLTAEAERNLVSMSTVMRWAITDYLDRLQTTSDVA